MKKAVIILAEGFEETEALVTVDILRRADVNVIIAGLGTDLVTGAHGITVKADTVLEDNIPLPDAVILPGGMPGTKNLAASHMVKNLILRMDAEGKLIAAICAAPARVLAAAGVLDGKKATCYPGEEEHFTTAVKYVEAPVVQDGNIITSRGPATAFDFGYTIAVNLAGIARASSVTKGMLYAK
ncbi:MAG: DJ-1 family glyoxalase III [Candidatus Omnitrophota bacterium]